MFRLIETEGKVIYDGQTYLTCAVDYDSSFRNRYTKIKFLELYLNWLSGVRIKHGFIMLEKESWLYAAFGRENIKICKDLKLTILNSPDDYVYMIVEYVGSSPFDSLQFFK